MISFTSSVTRVLRSSANSGFRFRSTVAVPTGTQVEGFTLRNEENYRVVIKDAQTLEPISPWHDVPLFHDEANKIYNFVNEIPKGAVEKMEVATDEPGTPIKQDTKKGKLRLYPFASLVNYGCLPQTWEDPKHADEHTGMLGDNDPVDVVEVGSRVASCGEIYPVKMLGILGMIDEGEMDWKAIAIDVTDPLSSEISTIADLEEHMPGKVDSIVSWFKTYKMPDGKPMNEFAFDDQAKDADFAHDVVKLTHGFWADKNRIAEEGLSVV